MKLVPNWRDILKKAWSVRWMYLVTLLAGIEVILPLFQDVFAASLARRVLFAALTLLAILLGIVSRVIEQKEISGER